MRNKTSKGSKAVDFLHFLLFPALLLSAPEHFPEYTFLTLDICSPVLATEQMWADSSGALWSFLQRP